MVALPLEIILLPGSKSDLDSLNEFEPFTVSQCYSNCFEMIASINSRFSIRISSRNISINKI
jgi:hypothetical protein